MIKENLYNETEIRRFLLGEMPEDKRTAFEEKFVTDEGLFKQMRVVEDELIESYIRGTLSAVEKEKFERSFLSTEPRRRRVVFARTMLDKFAAQKEIAASKKIETAAGNPSVWNLIANFFKTPKLAFGAAFAILISIFGGWLLLRSPNQTEIARQTTPTPTIETIQPNQNSLTNQNGLINSNTNIAEKNPVNKNASPNANRELPNKNQNANTPKQDSIGVAPVLALFAGTVRA
ncbi:MAG: hypothetical protein M3Q78_10085, partial [Acidobacteriota bacterium]|nr:hypothetical protein [Acidobacteriota bacterium]